MKLKELKWQLTQVKPFTNPNVLLEQYITPSELAAHLLYTAHISYNDIAGKNILDLCSGTGMLAIAASFFDPLSITCVEIDSEAVKVCKENFELFDLDDIEIINCSYEDFEVGSYDTIFMNPPFGTKNKGADVKALDYALKSGNIVYSFHKQSTRDYFVKKYSGLSVIAELKFDLPSSYKFHKKDNKIIDVDLYRITPENII